MAFDFFKLEVSGMKNVLSLYEPFLEQNSIFGDPSSHEMDQFAGFYYSWRLAPPFFSEVKSLKLRQQAYFALADYREKFHVDRTTLLGILIGLRAAESITGEIRLDALRRLLLRYPYISETVRGF